MAQIIYSNEAFTDFERIVEFLLDSAPDEAGEALENIRSAIGILQSHPYIGRRVREDIREIVISRGARGYLALYRFDVVLGVVRILRIRHQREAGYRD